jgi:hypothetical protein
MTVAKAAGVVIAQSKRNPGRPAAGLRPNDAESKIGRSLGRRQHPAER